MLQVQNISFGYTDKAVIKNIDFTIEKGQNVAIIGESSIENIIINTIIPLLVTYSQRKDDARYIEKAIRFCFSICVKHLG